MNLDQKIFNSFEEAGIYGITQHSGQKKVKCPRCGDERKNKRDKSLSVDVTHGVWNCHHCSWAGGLAKDEYTPFEKKSWQLPVEVELPLGEKVIKWFEDRKIEKRVLERFKIGENFQEGGNWINFPYYRDGVLVNIKKRSARKDFRLTSGAELIFYNLDSMKDSSEVVITEGEIDAMSLYQVNVFSCISVPNGASKGSLRMEYLDNCADKFEHLKKIVLCTDNDEPGLVLREELSRRLGRDRCFIVDYPEGCKDSNEVLIKKGSVVLRKMIDEAKPYPIEDISTPKDYLEQILEYHRHGFPSGDRIGHPELDKYISFRPGELFMVSGIPGSGKSAWLDHVLIRLACRHGWRHAVLSREQWPHSIHVTKLTQIFTGKGLRDKDMKEDMIIRANSFLDEHFFLFGIADLTLNGILEKAKSLVLRHGIKSLTIDPWNTLTHDRSGFGSETEYVNEVLKIIVKFKDLYGCTIFLVAHPTKIQKEGIGDARRYAVPTLYDISGSAHFFNMTDNGIVIYRNIGTRSDKKHPLGDSVTVYVQKVRNFFIGSVGDVTFDFDYMTGNYAEEFSEMQSEYKTWIDALNKEAAKTLPIEFGQAVNETISSKDKSESKKKEFDYAMDDDDDPPF